MYNFFNNTDTDQHDHDHDHGTAGSDVYPNDDNNNNTNSESTHDNEERNQHKQEKESKDMNRIIKNSIAPMMISLAASIIFTLCLTFNALGFDNTNSKGDDLNGLTVPVDICGNIDNSGPVACSSKADNPDVRFNFDSTVKNGDANIASIEDNQLNSCRDGNLVNADDDNLALLDGDSITYDNGNKPDTLDDENFACADTDKVMDYNDKNPDSCDNDEVDIINNDQNARVDSDRAENLKVNPDDADSFKDSNCLSDSDAA